ncbi:MAG: hypothetical protein HDT29_05090 [Clostridiales bacterium]|nr:hypothetical protein [Clostridiales bacterium]
MQEEFEIIASDEQIEQMNREFKERGVEKKISQTHSFSYPLPVYMTDACLRFCKCSYTFTKIVSSLDRVFISRNQRVFDFILGEIAKNRICIANTGNITQEIFVTAERMPIKQSMYKLLGLHNEMSMILSEIGVYDKSAQMQEIVLRHVLLGSVLHGICI